MSSEIQSLHESFGRHTLYMNSDMLATCDRFLTSTSTYVFVMGDGYEHPFCLDYKNRLPMLSLFQLSPFPNSMPHSYTASIFPEIVAASSRSTSGL